MRPDDPEARAAELRQDSCTTIYGASEYLSARLAETGSPTAAALSSVIGSAMLAMDRMRAEADLDLRIAAVNPKELVERIGADVADLIVAVMVAAMDDTTVFAQARGYAEHVATYLRELRKGGHS